MQDHERVRLPRGIIAVMARHRLGGVEAMLLLHLLVRWPAESFGDGTIMALEQGRAGEALGVCSVAIDRATDRLRERRLVRVELFRGRRHVRITPLRFLVGELWPLPDDPGAATLERRVFDALIATASRGRDAVALLALLFAREEDTDIVALKTAGLAKALEIDRRTAQRIVARLVRRGLIRRDERGFDLSPLVRAEAGGARAPTNRRYLRDVEAAQRRVSGRPGRSAAPSV